MRNLKRVLSLALASVMLLGMMVIGASAADKTAADLTDMDKVTNKEAVSLMVDLGIIVGKPDGSYSPAETVDRATMAKLIYSVLEASTDASAFTGVSSVLTDVKGNWAEGYINYCYSLGIVAGTGNNTFNPNGKVSLVSAAKMLLVSLGYDAKLSKYENDPNWSVNIMKDAQKAGLLASIDQKTNEDLTRDNAAQLIFNAMLAKTVVADTERDQGVEYLKKYINNDTTLGYETYGLVKVTAKVSSITDGKADLSDVDPTFIAPTNVSGKISASASAIGQKVTFYVKATGVDFTKSPITGTFKSIYTSAIASNNSNLLGSKVGASIAKMTDKTDKTNYVAAFNDSVTFYYNGDVIKSLANGDVTKTGEIYYNTSAKAVLKAAGTTAAANDSAVIVAGVVVEFFDGDSDGKADVVKVTEKTVKKVTGAVKTKIDDDGVVTVYVPGVAGTSTSYVTAKGYEDLKKDDIVLIYTNSDVTYIEKAATEAGKVTGRNSDNKIKVNGTYYGKSGLAGTSAADIGSGTWTDFDNEYTFYLDNGNNVVSYTKNTDKTSSDYAVILTSKWIDGGTIGNSDYMQAKVLLSDGTTEIVTVTTIGGKTVVKAGTTPASDEVVYTNLTATNGFFTYVVDKDGKYELTAATADTKLESNNTIIDDTAIKNNSKFLNGGTTYLADDKTVFVVEKGTGSSKTYSAYTGAANVPGMTASSGVIVYDKTSTVAKYVFLTTTAFSGDVAKGYVFVVDPSKNEYDPDTKTYSFKTIDVDGSESTIKVKNTNVITSELGTTKASQGLVEINAQDSDKVVTEVTKVTPATLTTISGGILKVGTNVYDYDSDTEFYVIDVAKDNAIAASEGNTVDLDDDGYTYTAAVISKDGTATIVYVIRTAL